MWISRGDDFLNITDAEYNELVKTAWNGLSDEDKQEYKNNFMIFRKEFEEYDEEYFYISDNILEAFNQARDEFSGREISLEKLQNICSIKGIKSIKIEEPNIYSIFIDDEKLDEDDRDQLNWEYSFDIQLV